ncbi:surface protease GP63, partial [Trypanosoma theileri]
TGVVRELPRKGQSGVQAYAVSTQKKNENEGWELIRIKALTENLDEHLLLCSKVNETKHEEKVIRENRFGEDDGRAEHTKVTVEDDKKCGYKRLPPEERNELMNEVIPAAIQLHRDRLLVRPVSGKLKVPEFKDEACNFFTVPKEHRDVGVDADFALYVIATKTTFGYTCAWDSTGRPIVGAVSYVREARGGLRLNVRRAAQQIAHALGFKIAEMQKKQGMLPDVELSEETRALVKSTRTVEKAQKHYSCPDLEGMELETIDGEIQPHWSRRIAKDELMAPSDYNYGAGYYTALTMALFEDLQYYKANWGMEEQMSWGNQSGCPFLEKDCRKKHNEFYDIIIDEKFSRCTSDRTAYGKFLLNERLSKEYQRICNLSESYYIGRITSEDPLYCNDESKAETLPGSIKGPNSWCLDGEGLKVKENGETIQSVNGVCAQVSCDYEKRTVSVKYKGNQDKWHDCPEGTSINVESSAFQSGGKIKCPKYDEVCTIALNGSSHVPFVDPHPAPPAAGPTSLQGDQGNNGTATVLRGRRDAGAAVNPSTTSDNTQDAAAAGTTSPSGKENANIIDPSKYPGVVNQAQINNMQNESKLLIELAKDDAHSAVCSLPIMIVTMVLAVVLSC